MLRTTLTTPLESRGPALLTLQLAGCVPNYRGYCVPQFSSVGWGNGSFCLVDSLIMPLKAVRTEPGAGKGHSPVSHVDVIRHAAVARPRQWFLRLSISCCLRGRTLIRPQQGRAQGRGRASGTSRFSGLHGKSGVAPRGGLDERRKPVSGQVRGDSRGSAGAPERPPVARGGRGRSRMAHRAKSVALGGCRGAALRPFLPVGRRAPGRPAAGSARLPVRG